MANSIFQNFIQVFRTPTAFVDTYPGFLVQSELDERFGLLSGQSLLIFLSVGF